LTFAPSVAIRAKLIPSVERCSLNVISLLELSLQARLILLDETAAAVRFEGASGTAEAAKSGTVATTKAKHREKTPVGIIITINRSSDHAMQHATFCFGRRRTEEASSSQSRSNPEVIAQMRHAGVSACLTSSVLAPDGDLIATKDSFSRDRKLSVAWSAYARHGDQ